MTKMTPVECVQFQLDAYNERDLEKFLAAFSGAVRSYRLPNMALLLDGKTARRHSPPSMRKTVSSMRG